MPAYMVTYDKRPGVNYDGLHDYLRMLNGRSPAQSVWFVISPYSAEYLRNSIRTFLGAADRLIVIELKIGADWATRNADENGAEWLSANVAPSGPPSSGQVLGPLASLYR